MDVHETPLAEARLQKAEQPILALAPRAGGHRIGNGGRLDHFLVKSIQPVPPPDHPMPEYPVGSREGCGLAPRKTAQIIR